MSWLQVKYISLLGSRLRNFKKKNSNLYNFSCPICNDSQTNRFKARGYLYEKSGNFSMKCFNCQASMSFDRFLKIVDENMHSDFRMELFQEFGKGRRPFQENAVVAQELSRSESWKKLVSPIEGTEGYSYLQKRKIPEEKIASLYYTTNINDLKPEFPRYELVNFAQEARIVVPIFTQSKTMIGMITRAIDPKAKLRYVNLKRESDLELIYNLENLDQSKRAIVVEGAFDSMFLTNSIAVDGADFSKASKYIDKERDVLVYDNTPKNLELLKQMEKMILENYKICIWPEGIRKKDINEMVLSGMEPKMIEQCIFDNAFSGLAAKLEFAKWRKR